MKLKFFSKLLLAITFFVVVAQKTQANQLPAKYVEHVSSKELNPFKLKGTPAITWTQHMENVVSGKLAYLNPVVGTSTKYATVAADILNAQIKNGYKVFSYSTLTASDAAWVLQQAKPVIVTIEAGSLLVMGVDPVNGSVGYFLNQKMIEASMMEVELPDGTKIFISKYGDEGNCLNLVFDLAPRTPGLRPEGPPQVQYRDTGSVKYIPLPVPYAVHDTFEKLVPYAVTPELTPKPEDKVSNMNYNPCTDCSQQYWSAPGYFICPQHGQYDQYMHSQGYVGISAYVNIGGRQQPVVYYQQTPQVQQSHNTYVTTYNTVNSSTSVTFNTPKVPGTITGGTGTNPIVTPGTITSGVGTNPVVTPIGTQTGGQGTDGTITSGNGTNPFTDGTVTSGNGLRKANTYSQTQKPATISYSNDSNYGQQGSYSNSKQNYIQPNYSSGSVYNQRTTGNYGSNYNQPAYSNRGGNSSSVMSGVFKPRH